MLKLDMQKYRKIVICTVLYLITVFLRQFHVIIFY